MQTFCVDESVLFTANTDDKTVKWSVGGTNASAIALYSDAGCTVSRWLRDRDDRNLRPHCGERPGRSAEEYFRQHHHDAHECDACWRLQRQQPVSSLTNPGNAYVLNKGTNGVGFYRLAPSGTIGANKAYLTYSGSLVREFFLFEDDATGINEELRSFSSMKSMKKEESSIYNLAGQRIQKMQKGINIVNGKKVLKKSPSRANRIE